MAITQGDNGGGGSTTNVCPIGPQDQVGSIDNILSRLTAIETILSQLLGTDITAIQLSDISQDMGTILGGTLGGGILSNIPAILAKQSVFAVSGGDRFIIPASVANNVSWSTTGEESDTGTYSLQSTSTSVNSCAGLCSRGQMYFLGSDTFFWNPYGAGFYFSGKFAFNAPAHETSLTGLRFFAGLQTGPFDLSTSVYNADNPGNDAYVGFQYSAPRGDYTLKIIVKDQDPVGVFTQHVYDTGVFIKPIYDEFTGIGGTIPTPPANWYEMSLTNQPNSSSVEWSVTDIKAASTISGSVPGPVQYEDHVITPPASPDPFNVGAAIYNNESGKSKDMYVGYIFAQRLGIP